MHIGALYIHVQYTVLSDAVPFCLFFLSGAVREAGGAFGKKEKAQEDQYFRQEQQKQLDALKGHIADEISHHKDEIKRHQEAIKRHEEKAKKLK